MKDHISQTEREIEKKAKKNAAVAMRPKNILEAFENIVELAEDSNLNADFFDKASIHINYAVRKLKLTKMQVVLLSIFIDRSEDNQIMISEIARYLGCRTTRILRLSDDIDVLEEARYVRAARSHNTLRYRVPSEVLKSLRKNQAYSYKKEDTYDIHDFFDHFRRLVDEKEDCELSLNDLMRETFEMLEDIKDSVFARALQRNNLNSFNKLVFIYMAYLFVENSDDNIGFHDIEKIFDEGKIPGFIRRPMCDGSSPLFKRKLIEHVNDEGMIRSDTFKLTDIAKEEILGELSINKIGRSDRGLIKADSIVEKRLVYNTMEADQIGELSSILEEKRFNDVQTRLRKAGMRPGFCCIFYGAPGTGKTETVYQIARNTGRDIMRVDVDKIKSCWVGESEKNIKALFSRYHNICKNSRLAPILLFNEADAVLGVRMEGAARAVDKMENSIQNIILQEMESLDGILIATTNLTTNLDKAFERRFLYKIRFEKPSLTSRVKIWRSMLEGLKEKDAEYLAAQFDLSGGEIENIVRKQSVNAILTGNDLIDIEEIAAACRRERISNAPCSRIGF